MCNFGCFCQCGCSDDSAQYGSSGGVDSGVNNGQSAMGFVSKPEIGMELLWDAIAGLEIVDEPILLTQEAG